MPKNNSLVKLRIVRSNPVVRFLPERDYITLARSLASSYRGSAASYQQMAATSQASADKYDQYADFFISIESDPYLQTSHWETLAQARHDSLTVKMSATQGSFSRRARR